MRKFQICKGFENTGVMLPKRKTKYSAGYDISSNEECDIKSGETRLVSTGIKAKMEADEVLKIYSRSSLGLKKGLTLANSVGIIDSDYFENEQNDGHIMVALHNFSLSSAHIDKGERIAQGIFSKYLITDDDNSEDIRKGGFGSTNKK
jgi:dUTP pyrophosphatase